MAIDIKTLFEITRLTGQLEGLVEGSTDPNLKIQALPVVDALRKKVIVLQEELSP